MPRTGRCIENLGYHWGYKREVGEPQITFNYVKAFADFINNFTFSRSVHFTSAREYQHIIPALVKRIWEVDNEKPKIMWEIGQQGGVSGDVFIKVAYEKPWISGIDNNGDPIPGVMQTPHDGKVRLLPLNSAFCFPEWHPHDRDRLLRFKLKYRFWGTSQEGTRQVFTYTEILTDNFIEEYLNDELIDSRPNPLGTIPIVHISNIEVSGSPWGLSDIGDIVSLNREYNEKATDISDIINYHAAPVTILTGAKASDLMKGPKKVWGGLPKDANVFNLENGVDLAGPMAYLELIKRGMHEMTGVPETALGQIQAISNTSGVALAVQYQPMMQRYNLKRLNYSVGFKKVNELALKTLFIFEPDTVNYDPNTEGLIQPDQPPAIDPDDPLIYLVECEWPAPLPVDKLIKLQEIQMMFMMGLESKRGALNDLGEEFPDEKLEEIFEELLDDAKMQGSLDLIKAEMASAIFALTGMAPEGMTPPPPPAAPNADGKTPPPPPGPGPVTMPGMDVGTLDGDMTQQLLGQLVERTFGQAKKIPMLRRVPDNN